MTATARAVALSAGIRRLEGGAVVDLRGDIDGGAEGALTLAYADAEATGLPVIVLNFASVGYINSTGIASSSASSRARGRPGVASRSSA